MFKAIPGITGISLAGGGYRGRSADLLGRFGVTVGDEVMVTTNSGEYRGVLLPRYEFADDQHIVVKLRSGYNIGVRVSRIQNLTRLQPGAAPQFTKPPLPALDARLPRVALLATGGTIASRIDYRTGGVHAAFSAEELYAIVPELASIAQVEAELLFNVYSENLTQKEWGVMAQKVAEHVRRGVRGVVIGHGTDTMGYTAAALSFALPDVPVPVCIVGAQRSTDRPSSDAAENLIAAVEVAARAPFRGVFLVMHAGTDDTRIAVHRGARVRKNHTSRRDAFESVDVPPAAFVEGRKLVGADRDLPSRSETADFQAAPEFERRVALLKFYPSMDPGLVDNVVSAGYRGLVLEGSGLGHVSHAIIPAIRRAIDAGMMVAMTSQCIWGRLRMTVYDTGRDLLQLGVLPLENMLAETALIKMMWVLAHARSAEEARRLMLENLAGEIAPRSEVA